ncbi:MAG TPA: HDOD domain-containing protein [Bryobacteraceae bacterium]|nr:HDOD domain-containing protein [Bryobacteraceae bacterium]
MSASANSLPVKKRALRALEALPPLSPVLHRVIASLVHEDVSFAKVAELIEKDTVLTGNILQLVNSPLYGLQGTVSSVRHAIAILGVHKLRNTVLGVSASQMWRTVRTPAGWSMSEFNRHSVSVAILADLLSQHVPHANAAGAFVAGLFHDLGLLLIAVGLPAEYKEISRLCEGAPHRAPEHELEVLGTTHAELCAEALAIWNLPAPICTAVRYHIRPELDPTVCRKGEIALSRLLHSANLYVTATENSLHAMEAGIQAGCPLESLGLGDRLPIVLSEYENELAAIQPYF